MEKKSIIPPRTIVKDSRSVRELRFTKYYMLLDHFNDVNLSNDQNYADLLIRNNHTHSMDLDKFQMKFYDNSYNFLDLMFFTTIYCMSNRMNFLNFLVSEDEYYMPKNFSKYKHIKFENSESRNNIITDRQFFTIGFLSLFIDYFDICDKQDKNTDEELLVNLFHGALLNNYKLINGFNVIKKSKTLKLIRQDLNIIFENNEQIIPIINDVKDNIKNYYQKCLLNKELNGDDKAKYFVNFCNDKFIFNKRETQELYQDLINAFNTISVIEYQDLFCGK